MSYEVTATRRRPQKFEDLVGQEFVAQTFRNSIESKKIAHAYLFSGPRGCGKTSTARILAKALNCAEGPTATPCGHCQQCIEITKGSCTDVIEIDGASNTSVNDVRQIKDEVLFPPQSCKYKIYIIDEVHMLSTSAFNALLKTIEEPPPYVIFIFATTELQKVPATIKSRCQQFNFRLVPIEKVKEQLALAAKEINISADDEALYWIARESTGSMRDAYTLFDQVAAFSGDKITYDKIRDKLGLVGVDRLNAIFEDCANNKSQSALEKLDVFLQAGISIEQLISNSTDYLRSLLLIKNGITKEALLGQNPERFSADVLAKWNSIQLERAISIFLQLYRDIRYSLNPRYELELAFSRLSWLSEYVSPAEVKKAIDSAHSLLMNGEKKSFSSGGAEPPYQAAVQEKPFIEVQQQPQKIEPIKGMAELKKTVLNELSHSEKTAILATTLIQTGDWVLSGDVINTSVASSFTQSQLSKQSSEISAIISKYFGQPVRINVSVKHSVSPTSQENAPQEVQLLCSLFRGQIVAKGDKIDTAKHTSDEQTKEGSDESETINLENINSEEDDYESV